MVTPECILCGRESILEVPMEGFVRWQAGDFTQVAFPDLTPDEREMLINGTHPECFDKIAGPPE